MFFDNADDFERLISLGNFSIIVMPKEFWPNTEKVLTIVPDEKGVIGIEQVRAAQNFANKKVARNQTIFVHEADKLTEAGQNAFLKLLEEPNEQLHLVFLTMWPMELLPTINSRAKVYFLREKIDIRQKPMASADQIQMAKELIAANGKELVGLAEKITKVKDKQSLRSDILAVAEVAIEILYKSYLINGNAAFLEKMAKFIRLHENLSGNGHIKLHLVADLC